MKIRFEFKLQDIWIGIYWKLQTVIAVYEKNSYTQYDIWICIVPCFPIHLTFNGKSISMLVKMKS